jgi:hypothetical protein
MKGSQFLRKQFWPFWVLSSLDQGGGKFDITEGAAPRAETKS